jgi:two-component system sensor histidine kinase KdpD
MSTRPADSGERPSPEALLRAAARAEQARLKIFLGSAPGVGKTFAMLQDAWERKREGVDVVVGVVETHGREETKALVQGLEVIPRRRLEYRERGLDEMDLDAVLARRPQLVLVDELAHTNVPGSRHAKRFADIEEILAAGIDVYTTVNIQHLESLNDVVAQITGVRVRETVPDRVLERAAEIKLIDLPPEDLIQRLREGKVYAPEVAGRAVENYFSPGNLTALRELALRLAAERVDDEMQTYMRAHAIAGPWAVTERMMVCLSGGPLAERLVRAARRMAARRRAEWIALFVEPAGFDRRPEEERERIARALHLAEQLGGEAVTIPGRDVATEIVRYARERNVTELVLGKTRRSFWRELWRRSPIDEVVRGSGDIDVRIVGHERDLPTPKRARFAAMGTPGGYAIAVLASAASGALAKLLQTTVALPDPSMVFLTGVLMTAVLGGLAPSLVASVLCLLIYDFFFVDPLYTFTIGQPQDVVLMLVFLIVAVLTSQLTARARDEAAAARRREARTGALYAFSRQVAAAVGLDDLLPIVARSVAQAFGGEAVVLLPAGERLVERAREPSGPPLGDADLGAATWVWQRGRPAGRGTDTLPAASWLFEPLHTARGVVGVLGVRLPNEAGELGVAQRDLYEALARQAAVAVERTRIDVVLEEKSKTEQIMEASEDGLIVLDPAGTVVAVNEVACAILGLERPEVLAAIFDDLASSHPHYLRLREAVREFRAQPQRERERLEITLFLRGRDHHYVLRPTPWRTREGQPAGLILALQDVTYIRDQERRREHLVATLSHELGTPLTSLRMALELLRRDTVDDPKERRATLDAAFEDVVRLEDVARRFLDLARARAMTIALERAPVDVRDLVDRVTRIFLVQAREKGIALEADPVPAVTIAGDQTKLTWALSNLVANALRYTPRDGRVHIDAQAADGTVSLSVSDTGPGIPPEQRERIFERFTQSAESGELGAAGLGLAIVRDIVQAHGGRIHLESTVGRGTRFTLELPRA